MHVTQLLKKETEAETPEREGEREGEEEGLEAQPSARCPSSGCRRVGSLAEPEREPRLGEAEPGWAVWCSSLHPGPRSGRDKGLRTPCPCSLLRCQPSSGGPLFRVPTLSWVGKEAFS